MNAVVVILIDNAIHYNRYSMVEINHQVVFCWLMLINKTFFGNDVNSNGDPNIHIHST